MCCMERSTLMQGQPARSPWAVMQPVQGRIRLAIALSALSSLLNLCALGLLAALIEALLRAPDVWPWSAMAGVLACTAGAYLLRLVSFDQSHYAAFRLETLLRTRLSEHLAQVSLGVIQRLGAGALAKVMHDDVKALHAFVADSTPLYSRAYATPAITFFLLLWLDWRLALGATLVLMVGFAVLSLAMRNRSETVRMYNEARERVSAAVIEFVQAMPVVRTFDTGQSTFGRYQRALETYRDALAHWYRTSGFAARFSMAALNPMPTLAVLLWLGAWLIWRESLGFHTWIAVLLLGTGMAEAMMPLVMLHHMIDKAKLSIVRIHEVLDTPAPTVVQSGVQKCPRDASVAFERVSFRYGEHDSAALSEVSFVAEPGSVTALVGPSGAGKTTVARLIPRFWDVNAGRVLVGGVDVRHMSADTLMAQIAFVFQENFLFADTVANNIRVGMPEADPAAVTSAAKAAQAHEFITALPRGYDTPVGERGSFLSGGQRQRITIARAILQNRPILVLDEATAFADPENEAALVQALSALMRGKTVIMIAHRLSTVRDADQILVFDRGHLAESGRHETLLQQHGVYARLWAGYEQAQNWSLRMPDRSSARSVAK
jgi:ATP-binding cassette subfamily B protein IrtA